MSDPLAAYEEPPRVAVIDGEVVMIGDGVCAAYTPSAAQTTAERLLLAAQFAREQNAKEDAFRL